MLIETKISKRKFSLVVPNVFPLFFPFFLDFSFQKTYSSNGADLGSLQVSRLDHHKSIKRVGTVSSVHVSLFVVVVVVVIIVSLSYLYL